MEDVRRGLANEPERAVAVAQQSNRHPGEGPEQPVIGGSEIKERFELDQVTHRKVRALLFSEGWFSNGGGGDADGDCYRVLRAEILHLRGVTEIIDLPHHCRRRHHRKGRPPLTLIISPVTAYYQVHTRAGDGGPGRHAVSRG